MESNLLKFPEHKIVRENVANIDVVEKAREKGILAFANEVVNGILDDMVEHLDYAGLEFDSPENQKDLIYASEAIRSMVYRVVGLKHDIQEVVNNIEPPEVLEGE